MKVIYSCYWGSYLAVVAASLHLGHVDFEKYNRDGIVALAMFNQIKNDELGKLFFIGMDDKGREVYIIGSKNTGEILDKTLKGIAEIYGFRTDSVFFMNLNPYYNELTLLGIFMIRRLGLVKLGLKLLLKGIGKSYYKLKEAVQSVKDMPVYRE